VRGGFSFSPSTFGCDAERSRSAFSRSSA